MPENTTFVLSIETDAGTYDHGFHLGTDVRVAQSIAEEAYSRWTPKVGSYIKTVALKRNGQVFVFDGEWSNQPK